MFARLLLIFVTIPLIELVLFIVIGSRIGLAATVAIILLTGILGAALARAQGLRTLARYRQAIGEGRMPHAEVIEGLIILAAGALLVTPGFLTDSIGFLLLVPPVRNGVARRLTQYLAVRIQTAGVAMPGMRSGGVSHPVAPGPVIDIEAEVMDEPSKP